MTKLSTLEKVKIEYESGNFTLLELEKKYNISNGSLYTAIKEEGWIKGKTQADFRNNIAKYHKQKLIEAGLKEEKFYKELKVAALNSKKIELVGDKEYASLPDHRMRLDAIKEINKMTDNYPQQEDTGAQNILEIVLNKLVL